MQTFEIEGLVLRVTPFQEKNAVVSLFTPHGLLSCFTYLSKQQSQRISPLTFGSFLVSFKEESNLYRLKSYHINESYPEYRQSLLKLEIAANIVKTIQTTQQEHNAAAPLFELTKKYLYKLKHSKNPKILELSFLLKLLKYEGLLGTSSSCSTCESKTLSSFVEGSFFCETCTPTPEFTMELDEAIIVEKLIMGRSFETFQNLTLKEATVERLLEQCLRTLK